MKTNGQLMPRGLVLAAGTALIAVLLGGCPNPIDADVARRMTDNAPPFVSIASPADGEEYLQTVTVSGVAEDSDGSIRTIDYVVSGTLGVLREEQIAADALGPDGTFTFSFSTVGFDGPVELQVVATDWNDNTATDTVSLQYSGSQLSSFSAQAGNKSVSLSWEPLPQADSYTLIYTDNGTLPSEDYGTSVELTSPSYELTNASNGALYTFLLSANVDGEPAFWSAYTRAIPLSPFTLAPRVLGRYRRIELEWQQIPGATDYEVYRATSPDGPYRNYTGTISGSTYTDSAVAEGVWYYYKVRPVLEGARLSTYNGAQSLAIPEMQERIRDVAAPAPTRKVAVSGDYSYVAAGDAGLLVMDVAEPAAPRLVGSVSTSDARDVAADGTWVYVADGDGGLVVVDASVPASPKIEATYTTDLGTASRLVVDGVTDQLFVIDSSGDTALYAFDVADPTAPQQIDVVEKTDTDFSELTLVEGATSGAESRVYAIASSTVELDVWILEYNADRAGGLVENDSRTFDGNLGDVPFEIAADGSRIFVLRRALIVPSGGLPSYSLAVYSGLGDATPGVFSSFDLSGNVADLAYADDRLVAVDEYRLNVFDVSDSNAPVRLYRIDTPAKPTGVAMQDGDYAYVAAGTPFFQTVDLKRPAPAVIGSYTDAPVEDVRVRGDHAYVITASPDTLQIVDVGSPSSPDPRGSVPIETGFGLDLSGSHAFVAALEGLRVVDVSDPSDPTVVGSVASYAGTLYAVEVKGDFAFMAGRVGLAIYDISDPSNPTWIGIVDSADGASVQDLTVRGSRAYLAEGGHTHTNTFRIVDISVPSQPAVVGAATDPTGSGPLGILAGVTVRDGYAFLSDSWWGESPGLYTIDVDPESGDYLTVSGPIDPVDGESATDLHPVRGVATAGDYVFAGTDDAGVVVLDASDPTAPVPIGSTGVIPSTSPYNELNTLRVSGSLVYAAARVGSDGGLYIVSLE